MKVALLYVDAGKGHYMPAKALADSFQRQGHEAVLDELFTAIKSPFWRRFCKYDWRFLLHHPRVEGIIHPISDTRLSYHLIHYSGLTPGHVRAFKEWYETNKPDFIVSTNFIGGIVLPFLVKKLKLNVPVFQYCADVFDTPKSGVNKALDMMYMPSAIGCDNAIKKGQPADRISQCPFPIQYSLESWKTDLTKGEMRAKLGLKDKFTILYALGGEGIGSPSFLYEIAKRGYDWQVVAIGGMSRTTTRQFNKFMKSNPNFDFCHAGFVSNVNEYLIASDIQVGKAGANALMESIFLHRPCLVSQVLYAFRAAKDFFAKHQIGWCEDNVLKQVDIAEDCFTHPESLHAMEEKYRDLPLEFNTDKFANQLINDCLKINASLFKD